MSAFVFIVSLYLVGLDFIAILLILFAESAQKDLQKRMFVLAPDR